MFPEAFVTEMLAKYPQATAADAERIGAWIAERHPTKPFTNPHGMFEKLLKQAHEEAGVATRYPLVTPKAKPDPNLYRGYDPTGACFRSPVPVTNPQTDFAHWIVREIRDQLLTPADVVRIVRTRPAAVYDAIGIQTLRRWINHTHYALNEHGNTVPCERECDVSCWASLDASSGLAEAIRSWGGWYPWANARAEWEAIVARDANRRTAA